MKNFIFRVVLLSGILSGCIAPVNLTYESARTLKKGHVDVQANAAGYFYPGKYGGMTNMNYGAKVGYGISDNYTLKIRYEHLNSPDIAGPFRDILGSITPVQLQIDYIEIENKIRLKNPNRAFGLPVAYYSTGAFSFDPRFYITIPNERNTVEFSFIPKMHIFFGDGAFFMPGLSLGLGLSKDLDRWAFRPEVGWDGFFAFGAALTFNLSKK